MDDRSTVLAIGEPLIELADIGDHRLGWTFGGDTFNCLAAVVATAPGTSAGYLTGLGDDPASAWFVEFADRLGIGTDDCPVVAGRNIGLSWISRSDGDRSFRYWRGESAARAVLSSGVDLQSQAPALAIVSSITLAVAGPAAGALLDELAQLRNSGTSIALDTNHRPALWTSPELAKSTLERALTIADVVHASTDDVDAVFADDARSFCDRAETAGAREVLVTAGAGPITALVEGRLQEIEPKPVEVVDTTGAGDAYFGTYLGRRLGGDGADDALNSAIDAATMVVGTQGALTYLDER